MKINRSVITGTAAIFIILSIIGLFIIHIYSMDAMNLENAVYMEKDKLKDDMLYLESLLENDDSIEHIENADYIKNKEKAFSPLYHHDLVENMAHDMGIEVAIYIRENNNFHCITSSILDSNGNPAVDVFLAEKSAAYASVQSGADYTGKDVILGNEYLTLYRPLFQPDTNEVMGILFTGIKMEAVKNIISRKNSGMAMHIELVKICAIALGALLIVFLIIMLNNKNRSEKSLNILKNILNGLNAMIYVTVPETGEILFINDYMKNVFNIKEDCVGQLCYKVFLRGADKKCDFCPCHQLDKTPDGTVVWEKENPLVKRVHHNTDRYIEWHNGRIVHIQHAIDVTDLIKAKEMAEQSSRFKSQFLSRMSHEVRTPMNAILGITEIQLQNETLPPGLREALDKIFNSGYLLLGIINDILDLSKIEAGKLELLPSGYDMPNLINDTVPLTVMQYKNKPISFNLQVDENIPLTLFGDELRIKQILNNILSNAFKYTDKGVISMSVSAEYSQQNEDPQVTLIFSITDTGHGMTAGQVDKLFDEYSRFDMEANRTTEGTGLGMNITKYLVRMMNGDIFVESEPGKGSVFTVRLPQKIIGSETLGKELAEKIKQFNAGRITQINITPQFVREYMPYGRVLVVDDVETNLYVARGLLTPYGLSIEIASNGFDAVEKIKNGANYDIIFMDHFMPKMDGIETAKIIRDLGYTRPIIALTANALTGQAQMFLENGFDDFISKPIEIRQLNASLNKFIRDKYPPEVIEAARRQAAKIMARSSANARPFSDPELAAIFIRDAEKSLLELKTILNNTFRRKDDFHQYVINVHSMKSSLANIGENGLSSTASRLELAGRAENTQLIMAETPAFLEELIKIIEKNRPKETGDNIAVENKENEAYLFEKLHIIRTACGKYDEITANKALSELYQKKWPNPTKDLLDTVAEDLLHSDFDEAAELINEFESIMNKKK